VVLVAMSADAHGRCFCPPGGPLCSFCRDAVLTRRLVRMAERRGDAWGRGVFRRRPDGTWPVWDEDTSGRLQAAAHRRVSDLHTDPGVLDRLARACAYHAGVAYRDEQRRRLASTGRS
jgi:hypothetical protein